MVINWALAVYMAGLLASPWAQSNLYCELDRGGREFMHGKGFQEIVPLPDGERFLTVFRSGRLQHLWLGKIGKNKNSNQFLERVVRGDTRRGVEGDVKNGCCP